MKAKFFLFEIHYNVYGAYPLNSNGRKEALESAVHKLVGHKPHWISAYETGDVVVHVERKEGARISMQRFIRFMRRLPDYTELSGVEITMCNKPTDRPGSLIIGTALWQHITDMITIRMLSDEMIKILLENAPWRGLNLLDMMEHECDLYTVEHEEMSW